MKEKGVLYSVWNKNKHWWATPTNFSTKEEAENLRKTIIKQCKDEYEVQARAFGSIVD